MGASRYSVGAALAAKELNWFYQLFAVEAASAEDKYRTAKHASPDQRHGISA